MHRDIKPDNIFIDENDEIKLGDFGGAKVAEKALLRASNWSKSTIYGTEGYIAPEILNFESYGSNRDVWSLG